MTRRFLLAVTLMAACTPAVTEKSPSPDPPATEAKADVQPTLLPAPVPGLTPDGEPDRAEGNDLFRLINGGAEVYLERGFVRAVSQEYAGEGGLRFTLEIFEMKDPDAARAIYTHKGGTADAADPIGDASTFEEYYGLYLVGSVHFTVTASKTRGELRAPIEQLARAAVAHLRQTSMEEPGL